MLSNHADHLDFEKLNTDKLHWIEVKQKLESLCFSWISCCLFFQTITLFFSCCERRQEEETPHIQASVWTCFLSFLIKTSCSFWSWGSPYEKHFHSLHCPPNISLVWENMQLSPLFVQWPYTMFHLWSSQFLLLISAIFKSMSTHFLVLNQRVTLITCAGDVSSLAWERLMPLIHHKEETDLIYKPTFTK